MGTDRQLTIISATGTVACDTDSSHNNGPDGGKHGTAATHICSYDGVSGIMYGPELEPKGKTMFLVGVFLGDAEPQDPAPPRLDFSETALTEHFLSLSPRLGQVFFIGDGLTETGSGTTQVFDVPDEATRLFLGFADSYDFGHFACDCASRSSCADEKDSMPGYYGDNTGILHVTLAFEDVCIPDCDRPDQ
jgi:hypothetical protein